MYGKFEATYRFRRTILKHIKRAVESGDVCECECRSIYETPGIIE